MCLKWCLLIAWQFSTKHFVYTYRHIVHPPCGRNINFLHLQCELRIIFWTLLSMMQFQQSLIATVEDMKSKFKFVSFSLLYYWWRCDHYLNSTMHGCIVASLTELEMLSKLVFLKMMMSIHVKNKKGRFSPGKNVLFKVLLNDKLAHLKFKNI